MKKNFLIILSIVIIITSLMMVMVACNTIGNQTVTPPNNGNTDIDTELIETTFFTAASNLSNPKRMISLISKQDNQEIYSMNTKGGEDNKYGIDFDGGTYINATSSLQYRADVFSESSIEKLRFTGKVANPNTFFGIQDSDVTLSNVVIIIDLDSGNELKQILITYDITVNGVEFEAKITITP